jgi:hypothetical protein
MIKRTMIRMTTRTPAPMYMPNSFRLWSELDDHPSLPSGVHFETADSPQIDRSVTWVTSHGSAYARFRRALDAAIRRGRRRPRSRSSTSGLQPRSLNREPTKYERAAFAFHARHLKPEASALRTRWPFSAS